MKIYRIRLIEDRPFRGGNCCWFRGGSLGHKKWGYEHQAKLYRTLTSAEQAAKNIRSRMKYFGSGFHNYKDQVVVDDSLTLVKR